MKNVETQIKQAGEAGADFRIRALHVLLFFIFHFSFFISCIDDAGLEKPEAGKTSRVHLSFTNGMTRAAGEEDIESIRVLVFEKDGEYLYTAVGTMEDVVVNRYYFTAELRAGTVDLMILINCAPQVAALNLVDNDPRTRDAILAALCVDESQWQEGDAIPMYGTLRGITLTSTTAPDAPSALQVPVVRMLAKIDVTLDAAVYDSGNGYRISEVYFYNRQTRGRIIPDDTNWPTLGQDPVVPTADKYVIAPTAPGSTNDWSTYRAATSATASLRKDYTATPVRTTGSFYLFEAFNEETGMDAPDRPGMVVGLIAPGESTTTYYRADIRLDENNQSTWHSIKRNYYYTYTVTGVTAKGEDTPDEAWKATKINIQATVVAWEKGYDEEAEIGGQNTFTLNQSYFVYPALNDEEGTPFIGSIEINSTADWTYFLSTSPYIVEGDVSLWFTGTRVGNTKNDVINFSIEENMAGKRTVYLHFKTGNLTHVATIFQRNQNDPNSYLLKPGGTLEFPVRKAYMVWEDDVMGSQKQTLTGAITCGVIWQDVLNLVTVSLNADGDQGNKTKLLVTANGVTEGNAVVGVYIGGTLRYSWHIWVTDYEPDTNTSGTTYLYNNGYQDYLFMDRNMGATTATPGVVTSLGNHYQWGRKDPFPGTNDITSNTQQTIYGTQIALLTSPTTTASTNSNNVHNTLIYPFHFYYMSDTPYDWYTTQNDNTYQNNYLWSDEAGEKGIFDPCPDGWRVPDWTRNASTGVPEYSPWSKWSLTNFKWDANIRGYTYTDGSFYPAAGYRFSTSGVHHNVGRIGYYWSASASRNGVNVYFLYFDSSSVTPASNTSRSFGLSVRCVQD